MLNVKGKIGGNSDLSERGQRVCVHTYVHTFAYVCSQMSVRTYVYTYKEVDMYSMCH